MWKENWCFSLESLERGGWAWPWAPGWQLQGSRYLIKLGKSGCSRGKSMHKRKSATKTGASISKF